MCAGKVAILAIEVIVAVLLTGVNNFSAPIGSKHA